MNCEDSKNLMAVGVYGELTPAETAQLEMHIRDCRQCAKIYERSETLKRLMKEHEDIPLPDKERSWRIISAKALKQKSAWSRPFLLRRPAFQFSFAALLLIVGFTAGYFIASGWQRGGEIAQLRQEVRQVSEIAAASFLRQETLNRRLGEMGMSSPAVRTGDDPLRSLLQLFRDEPDVDLRLTVGEDPYLLLRDPRAREEFMQSLSEQTSPLVEIALILAKNIDKL